MKESFECEFFVTKLFLNNRIIEADAALVSVDERGFRFGDGVFETIPVHDGIPYLFEYHHQRLEEGLKALRIASDTAALPVHALQLIQENRIGEGMLRMYISRGIGSRGYLPASATQPATLIMQTLPFPLKPREPVSLWLSGYEKISPRALPVHCKLAQGVNATLARMEAQDHDCYEALQCDAEGFLSEASSANLFWLRNGTLFTPSLACGALAGVTRRRLLELAPCSVQEGRFTLDDLRQAEAVFITNTASGILPVDCLLPQGFIWDSAHHAAPFIALRNRDIADYARRARDNAIYAG